MSFFSLPTSDQNGSDLLLSSYLQECNISFLPIPKEKMTSDLQHKIEQSLQTVYDSDFPLVDIYTLGLIYQVSVDEEAKKAKILMSFTTPACPMADFLIASVKNATLLMVPDYEVKVEITFDPMRSPAMIRDKDLQRMFE